jgi:hypothetical protein
LATPGSFPSLASFRKQILHIWNLRMYPRGRPQTRQRLTLRVIYFGFFSDLFIIAFLAMLEAP